MIRPVLRHDEANCIGCKACEAHCKTHKGLGPGPAPCRIVPTGPALVDGRPRIRFDFMPCFHCEDAGCIRICPTGAMRRRERDGIVFVQPDLCIGCQSCITACPWSAPQWNPATRKVVKCDLCMDRLDAGLKPACVTKCVTGCLSLENVDRPSWRGFPPPRAPRPKGLFPPLPPWRDAPCREACPAGIDIPGFMAHIGRGDDCKAIEVILRDNPLPLTCGLVCPAPCESACLRGGHDGAVFIRPMKSHAAEHCLAEDGYPRPKRRPPTGRRVGIVGSGPAGLSAAWYLRILGHEVEIFESREKAGGMLRYGIPAWRLPPDLLDRELEQIQSVGIVLHVRRRVENLADFRSGFDAVFLGLGTQAARVLPIEGVNHPFVLRGIDFLRSVRDDGSLRIGPRVVVIGGGNVAIDVAMTALRQGACRVDMVCRRKKQREDGLHEFETAVEENVRMHQGWLPAGIGANGRIVFNPNDRTEGDMTLDADHVILAVGQDTDLAGFDGGNIEILHGLIATDSRTLMTRIPGVFAGGDAAHGPHTVVRAIHSGKSAALAIDAWLRGGDEIVRTRPAQRAMIASLETLPRDRSCLPRAKMPERTVAERLGPGNHARIELGLTDDMARDEARRCLRCDLCIGCGRCQIACQEMGIGAIRMDRTPDGRFVWYDFTRPADRCIGCGACAQVCPTGAIRIEDGTMDGENTRRTVVTGTVVQEQPILTCSRCGAPTRTPMHLRFIRERLAEAAKSHLHLNLCPSCARSTPWRP